MGQLGNIICKLEEIGVDKDMFDMKGRYDFLQDIHMAISKDLLSIYPEIWFVKDYGAYKAVLGCEEPEKLKEIAKKWNKNIYEEAAKQMQKLEKKAKEAGKGSVSEFLRSSDPENISLHTSQLEGALSAVSDHFQYGGKYLVKSLGNEYYTTLISEDMKADIEKNPEEYFWAEIIYD